MFNCLCDRLLTFFTFYKLFADKCYCRHILSSTVLLSSNCFRQQKTVHQIAFFHLHQQQCHLLHVCPSSWPLSLLRISAPRTVALRTSLTSGHSLTPQKRWSKRHCAVSKTLSKNEQWDDVPGGDSDSEPTTITTTAGPEDALAESEEEEVEDRHPGDIAIEINASCAALFWKLVYRAFE